MDRGSLEQVFRIPTMVLGHSLKESYFAQPSIRLMTRLRKLRELRQYLNNARESMPFTSLLQAFYKTFNRQIQTGHSVRYSSWPALERLLYCNQLTGESKSGIGCSASTFKNNFPFLRASLISASKTQSIWKRLTRVKGSCSPSKVISECYYSGLVPST